MRELTIPLRLADVRDLFRSPDADPLSPACEPYLDEPALEYVASQLYSHPRARRVRLVVSLPPEKLSADLAEVTCAAIRRYSDMRANATRRASVRQRYLGLRTGVVAFFALFIVLGASVRLSASADAFESILGTGLGVVGWVLLWYPLDTLTYELWTERVERRAYEALQHVALELKADDGA